MTRNDDNGNASSEEPRSQDFIRTRVTEDIEAGKNDGRVHTRFPPEPNGYLHVGHSKAIALNFGVAREFGGLCNLRFDDTNPTKEEVEYENAIQEDIRWLGFEWNDRLYFASDYFEKLYDLAVQLIRDGNAYVDSLSAEEIREYRGTLTEPGRESPHRDRSVEENLEGLAGWHRPREGPGGPAHRGAHLGPAPDRDRKLPRPQGRPNGVSDRQPLRLRPDAHHGHRLRPRA